ncbi:hypothetical protein SXCC_02300 [Gluconacetobacter sp. SXCC-1]|nr:hypothetical protein SXCC_02300 [Gluconacetobacter sp. SXCC-1]
MPVILLHHAVKGSVRLDHPPIFRKSYKKTHVCHVEIF